MFSISSLFKSTDPLSYSFYETGIADQRFEIPRAHIRAYENIQDNHVDSPQLMALYPTLQGYTCETMDIIDSPNCNSELNFSLHEKDTYLRNALDEKDYELSHEVLPDSKRKEGDFTYYTTKHQHELVITNKSTAPTLVFLISSPESENPICETRFPFNQAIDVELSFTKNQLKNWEAIYEDIVLLVNKFAKPIINHNH